MLTIAAMNRTPYYMPVQPKKAVRFGAEEPPPVTPAPPPRKDPFTVDVGGLEDIIATNTAVGHVDPKRISLVYRGYEITDLVKNANYEETAYLLINGDLPNAAQAREFDRKVRTQRALPPEVLKMIKSQPKGANPMSALRSAVSMLAEFDPQVNDNSHGANVEKAIRLIAKIPTIIAANYRVNNGMHPIASNPKLTQAENFFWMMNGKKPDPQMAKILDTTMILYAEHDLNASTFAGRVTASALSDMHSAITSAIGTLKGPLHGGANEAAMEMLMKIGSVENVEPYLREALARKDKIMGFGHRVYKNGDTRAPILKAMAVALAQQTGQTKWPEIADKVEEFMFKNVKGIKPNVDFPAAYLYYMMKLPIEIYTPIFAAARIAGWSAHVIEQHDKNRIFRPSSIYIGPEARSYKPIGERA
jgi:citrate synthase